MLNPCGLPHTAPWQSHALAYFFHDPGFQAFLFHRGFHHGIKQRLRDHHRAIGIGHDDIARHYCHAAAANGFLPADEIQRGDGSRRHIALAINRQPSANHARAVAHHAICHQPCHTLLRHACA